MNFPVSKVNGLRRLLKYTGAQAGVADVVTCARVENQEYNTNFLPLEENSAGVNSSSLTPRSEFSLTCDAAYSARNTIFISKFCSFCRKSKKDDDYKKHNCKKCWPVTWSLAPIPENLLVLDVGRGVRKSPHAYLQLDYEGSDVVPVGTDYFYTRHKLRLLSFWAIESTMENQSYRGEALKEEPLPLYNPLELLEDDLNYLDIDLHLGINLDHVNMFKLERVLQDSFRVFKEAYPEVRVNCSWYEAPTPHIVMLEVTAPIIEIYDVHNFNYNIARDFLAKLYNNLEPCFIDVKYMWKIDKMNFVINWFELHNEGKGTMNAHRNPVQHIVGRKELERICLNLSKIDLNLLSDDEKRDKIVNKLGRLIHRLEDTLEEAKFKNEAGGLSIEIPEESTGVETASSLTPEFFPADELESLGLSADLVQTVKTFFSDLVEEGTPENLNLLLQLCLWLREFVNSTSLFDFISKITLCASHYFGPTLIAYIKSLKETCVNQAGEDKNWFNDIERGFGGVLSKHPTIVALRKFITACVAAYFLKDHMNGETTVLEECVRATEKHAKKLNLIDIVSYFVEVAGFIRRIVRECYLQGSITAVFSTMSKETTFLTRYVSCNNQYYELTALGLRGGVENAFDDLIAAYSELRALAMELLSSEKLGGPINAQKIVQDIDCKISDLKAMKTGHALHPTPISVMVFGKPNTNKSFVMTLTREVLALAFNISGKEANCWWSTYDGRDQWDSGYNGQQILILDDVANDALPNADNVALRILRDVNPVPNPAQKADIESKGKIFKNFTIVISSSNDVHSLAAQLNEPAALYRRFGLYVEVIVKDEYAGKCGEVDPEKAAKAPPGEDICTVNVLRSVVTALDAEGKQLIRFVPHVVDLGNGNIATVNLSMKDYCRVLKVLSVRHADHEKSALERVDNLHKFCEHGEVKDYCTICFPRTEREIAEDYDRANKIGRDYFFKKGPSERFGGRVTDYHHLPREDSVSNESLSSITYRFFCVYAFCVWFANIFCKSSWLLRFNQFSVPLISSSVRRFGNAHEFTLWLPLVASTLYSFLFSSIFLLVGIKTYVVMSLFGTLVLTPFSLFTYVRAKLFDVPMDYVVAQYSKAKKNYLNEKYRLAASGLAISAFVGLFIYLRKKLKNQASGADKIPDAWKKPIVIPTHVSNDKRAQYLDVENLLRDKTLVLTVDNCYVNLVPIRGTYHLAPAHFVIKHQGKTGYVSSCTAGVNGDRRKVDLGIENLNWVLVPNTDVVVISLAIDMSRDNSYMLPDSDNWTMISDLTLKLITKRRVTSPELEVEVKHAVYTGVRSARCTDTGRVYSAGSYVLTSETFDGMCGSPVITETKFPLLLGIHTQGSPNMKGRFSYITRPQFEWAVEVISRHFSSGVDMGSKEFAYSVPLVSEIHDKCPLQGVDVGGITPVGHIPSVPMDKPTFNIRRTEIADVVESVFPSAVVWGPPAKPTAKFISGMYENYGEFVNIPPSIVEASTQDYYQQLREGFSKNPHLHARIRPLTNEETVRGVPGVIGMDHMSINTSKGFQGIMDGKSKNLGDKSDLFWLEPNLKGDYDAVITSEFAARIEEIEEMLANKRQPSWILKGQLKDEAVKAKADGSFKDPRMFWVSPAEQVFLTRKWLLGFLSALRQLPPQYSESAIGVVASGRSWEELHMHINTDVNGVPDSDDETNKLFFDYSKFDRRQDNHVNFGRARMWYELTKEFGSGYEGTRESNILYGVLHHNLFPVFCVNSDVSVPDSCVDSGAPDTAPRNSANNSITTRCVVRMLGFDDPFRQIMKLATYGDDMMARSSHPDINHHTFCEQANAFGFVVTTETKGDVESAPKFSSMKEGSFLKRRSRFDANLGIHVGALDFESIIKPLRVYSPSKDPSVTAAMQLAGALNGAMDELFLHGEDFYKEKAPILRDCVKNSDARQHLHSRFWMSYEDRLSLWHDEHPVNQAGMDYSIYLDHLDQYVYYVAPSRGVGGRSIMYRNYRNGDGPWGFVEFQNFDPKDDIIAERFPHGVCQIISNDVASMEEKGRRDDVLQIFVKETLNRLNVYGTMRYPDVYMFFLLLAQVSCVWSKLILQLCCLCIRKFDLFMNKMKIGTLTYLCVLLSLGVRVQARVWEDSETNFRVMNWLPQQRTVFTIPVSVGGFCDLPCAKETLGCVDDLKAQSENYQVTEINNNISTSTDKYGTVTFYDGTPSIMSKYQTQMAPDVIAATMESDLSLNDFLKRPIRIADIAWTPGVAFAGVTIDPWDLFLSNKRVINRINNYWSFSGNLHVKIVLNGNAFYYGRMIADYQPGAGADQCGTVGLANDLNKVGATQRLHVMIDPTTSTGGEMVLPFIATSDRLAIASSAWTALGKLHFRNFNTLRHANAATTAIDVAVFAWMDDPKFYFLDPVNSSSLVNQSGKDEYPEKDVHQDASILNRSMSAMGDALKMSPYELAANAALRAAKSLALSGGLSRPPQAEETPMRRRITTSLSQANVSDGSMKLTLDHKQGLSIGSAPINLSLSDELDIKAICAKPSYVGSAFWDLTHAVNDTLLSIAVTPCVFATETVTPTTICPPPCMFAALPFRYWRGIMRYRFQIVASGFHKGRLLLTWTPNTTPSTELNITHSKIIDLDNTRDFTFDVPWGAQTGFLGIPQPPAVSTKGWIANGGVVSVPGGTANGVVTVSVLTTLAVPNSTAASTSVGINWYVSMVDATFGVPCDDTITNVQYVNQSGETQELVPTDDQDGAASAEKIVDGPQESYALTHVFMGEEITNFRALLKRFYHYRQDLIAFSSINPFYFQFQNAVFPKYQGTVTNGEISGVNNVRGTLINYLTPAFLAVRGGIRHKFIWHSLQQSSGPRETNLFVKRIAPTGGTCLANTVTGITARLVTTATLQDSYMFTGIGNGADMTCTSLQNVLEVEFPNQREYRFSWARYRGNGAAATPVREMFELNGVINSTSTADKYILQDIVAAGEDFSLLSFQGAPAFTLKTPGSI